MSEGASGLRSSPTIAVDEVAGWMFDVDGCLVRTGRAGGEGGTLFPGAAELLDSLRAAGHRFVCCTNASARTPAQYEASLRALGLPIGDSSVITAGYAAAHAAVARHPGAPPLLLGTDGVRQPLVDLGAELVHPDSKDIGVVIVAAASAYSTAEIAAASRAVADGAAFYVPVMVPWFYGGRERVASATCAVARGIAWVTGREPEVVGKPSTNVMDLVLVRLGLSADRVVVVGDSMEAEIAMAATAGAQSVWVATGAPRGADDAAGAEGAGRPTMSVTDIAELNTVVSQLLRRAS